jgi:hypothetical protein
MNYLNNLILKNIKIIILSYKKKQMLQLVNGVGINIHKVQAKIKYFLILVILMNINGNNFNKILSISLNKNYLLVIN